MALFNLLVAGYTLAAAPRGRGRLPFALGPTGVGLWALAWFVSVFQDEPSWGLRTLGSLGGLLSIAGFYADALGGSRHPRRLLVVTLLLAGAGLGAQSWLAGQVRLHAAVRPVAVALAAITTLAHGLLARGPSPARRVEIELFGAGVAAALLYLLFLGTTLLTERAGIDPLLFVLLLAELYALLYIVRGRVSVRALLSRSLTYVSLSLLVALGAALAFRLLGYPVDPAVLAVTVALALGASALFMGVADRMSEQLERLLFPSQVRLERALFTSQGELRALRRRLERAEKLAIAGELAASVAHEIKNPLAPIKGYAQLLAGRMDRIPESERPLFGKGLGIIREETERIDRRIQELLSVVRLDRTGDAAAERCDLSRVLEEAVLVAEGEGLGKRIRLELDPDLPAIRGNSDEMRGAFLNLLKNALEAMQDQEGGQVEITGRREGGRVLVEVKDEGPGLPAGSGERVFEAFYTTKQGGTGLGLAIARSAVDAAGGRLQLESRRDRRGAVAQVELCLADPVPEDRKEVTG